MSKSSLFLWCVSGALVITALQMVVPQPAPALTLESTLGPEVTTTGL